MESLVLANIKHRPARVIATASGVAVGTILILLIVGLAHGVSKERGTRESNMISEIIIRPPGSFTTGLGSNVLSMPVDVAGKIRNLPGVKSVTPVGQYVQSTESGLGFRSIEAIDFDSYQETTGIKLVAGKPPANDDEVIVDEEHARSHQSKPGDPVQVLDKTFKLAGIYSPEVGARIKVRLSMLQEMLSAKDHCTMLFVRCQNPNEQDLVAQRIAGAVPDIQIIFTRDLPRLYSAGVPAINTSLRVLVGLAVFISTLVVLLAMYTAIAERTREIGILKSLGASRAFIIWVIEKEALTISALGILIGYLIASTVRLFLLRYTSLRNIDFELNWIAVTIAVGLIGGLVGALYPAVRAARQDPVEALSYE
jgi:putative ABC transport system permease protein